MQPLVTIVTPSYNQGKYIESTIESVLSQHYPNIEYIVVDGGSTDNTLEVLRKHDNLLKWISEKDRGQADAINKGFRMAKGEILAWLNSDDIYLPGAVSKAVSFLVDHPEVMMVYGEGYMIDAEGAVKRRFPFTEPKFDLGKLIYYGDYILQQSTFFRRSVFDTIPMLDESLQWTLDWDLFIRIGKRFRVEYIPEYLGCIREHEVAKSTIGGHRRFREIVRTIRKHGIVRYPLSYVNYAVDTYAKSLFGESAIARTNGQSNRAAALAARALQRILRGYFQRSRQEYYTDNWVGKRAMFVVPNHESAGGVHRLVIEGEVHSPNVPLRTRVTVNGIVKNSCVVQEPGEFRIGIDLPIAIRDSDCFHIRVRNSRTFVPSRLGINADTRALGFLLKRIGIEE